VTRWPRGSSSAPRLPDLADFAAGRWPGITALERGAPSPDAVETFSIAYLATLRPDGAPRLHPFCPILAGGRLFGVIPLGSPKGDDLRRDPRCVIHALPGADDDELCIRARASAVADAATTELVRGVVATSGVGGMVESVISAGLFEFDLERVDVARWIDVGQPGTRAERRQWRAAEPAPTVRSTADHPIAGWSATAVLWLPGSSRGRSRQPVLVPGRSGRSPHLARRGGA